MRPVIYYAGTPAEVEHHARPLCGEFDVRIESAENVVRCATPGDVCLFFNEFFPRFRLAIHELVRRQCATLYAIDGILEWRSMWENPQPEACAWVGRPVLCHKVACIGRSQARLFESWGQAGQCEIVGIPRLDAILGRAPRVRTVGEPFTILVLTAKWPGFTDEQRRRTTQSLRDLKTWLEGHRSTGGAPLRAIWRITQGLEREVGVENSLCDTTGEDLAQALAQVDAVVTTPSTAMLEAMLQGLPVALLDYNNCPHYVPAAWRITAAAHFDQVLPELLAPPPAKMLYQNHLLHEALECDGPALPRLVELIVQMHEMAKRSISAGRPLVFPPRMLRSAKEPPPALAMPLDSGRLFPGNPAFEECDVQRLQAEVADLRSTLAAMQRAAERRQVSQRLRRLRQKAERMVSRLVGRADERKASDGCRRAA